MDYLMLSGEKILELADKIREIRDFHFNEVPIDIMGLLLRNLKTFEQELRVLKETENFMSRYYDPESEEYAQKKKELYSTLIPVNVRKVPSSAFDSIRISTALVGLLFDLLGG